MTLAQQIKKEFAKSIRARVRETNSVGLSGKEFKEELLKLLDRYIKSII